MFASTIRMLVICVTFLTPAAFASAADTIPLPPNIYPTDASQPSSGINPMSVISTVAPVIAGNATVVAANALTGGALLAPIIGVQNSAFYGGTLLGNEVGILAAPLMDYSGVITNSVVSAALWTGSFFAVSTSLEPENVEVSQ